MGASRTSARCRGSERIRGAEIWKSVITTDYGTGSAYALGAAVSVKTEDYKNDYWQYETTTTNTHQWWDGAAQSHTSFAKTNQTTYNTYYTYSGLGDLKSVQINDGRARTVTYTNDVNGQAVRRSEADNLSGGDPHEVWYRFAGKEMGLSGNNGTLRTDYLTSVGNRTRTPGTGAFRFGATSASLTADFALGLDPLNSYEQGSTAGSYKVRGGETLASIAAQLWGDSSLWYKIAEANGMSAANALVDGQVLTVPAGVMRNGYNASTFEPYDPSEVIGDTSPTNPKAPKKNKCGMLGQVVLVAVAIG